MSAANEKTQSHVLHFYLDLDQHHSKILWSNTRTGCYAALSWLQ